MEALSIILETKMSKGLIMHPITSNALEVSHLLLADDLLIFSKYSLQLAWHIKSTLLDFGTFSRLKANAMKSVIFLSCVWQQRWYSWIVWLSYSSASYLLICLLVRKSSLILWECLSLKKSEPRSRVKVKFTILCRSPSTLKIYLKRHVSLLSLHLQASQVCFKLIIKLFSSFL